MDPRVFRRFCEIAYSQAGISIKEGKESLVSARVAKRVRSLGLSSEKEYLAHLEADETGDELVSFLDAISTNYTRFFREPDHFDAVATAVGRWSAAGQRRFKLWSAASSSGEEPYTLAITLLERCPGVEFELLATDISTRVLGRASAAVYDAGIHETVARPLLDRYFVRGHDADGDPTYTVAPAVRRRLLFRRLNLAEVPYPMRGPLDIVFCRNVMIYFDLAGRQKVVSEVERLLKPGGMFVVGHSETLEGTRSSLRRIGSSVFCKPSVGSRRSMRPLAKAGAT
jgi:chemotaxis protein methyltransferase CheR